MTNLSRSLLLVTSLFLIGCQDPDPETSPAGDFEMDFPQSERAPTLYPKERPSEEKIPKTPVKSGGPDPTIRICSWNIDNIGSRHDRAQALVIEAVLEEYDLCVIQELQTSTNTIRAVHRRLARNGAPWRLMISDLPPDRPATVGERVAYIWNMRTIKLLEPGQYYPDDPSKMRRPIYRARFQANFAVSKPFDFLLATVHLHPNHSAAAQEIEHVEERFDVLRARGVANPPAGASTTPAASPEPDVILAGDFNGGPHPPGNSLRASDTAFMTIFQGYATIVQRGGKKTMVDGQGGGSAANDNIVFGQPTFEDWTGKIAGTTGGGVDTFDTEYFASDISRASRVSDHRPVYAEFFVNQDTN